MTRRAFLHLMALASTVGPALLRTKAAPVPGRIWIEAPRPYPPHPLFSGAIGQWQGFTFVESERNAALWASEAITPPWLEDDERPEVASVEIIDEHLWRARTFMVSPDFSEELRRTPSFEDLRAIKDALA